MPPVVIYVPDVAAEDFGHDAAAAALAEAEIEEIDAASAADAAPEEKEEDVSFFFLS